MAARDVVDQRAHALALLAGDRDPAAPAAAETVDTGGTEPGIASIPGRGGGER